MPPAFVFRREPPQRYVTGKRHRWRVRASIRGGLGGVRAADIALPAGRKAALPGGGRFCRGGDRAAPVRYIRRIV
jgi:hypothetical protein